MYVTQDLYMPTYVPARGAHGTTVLYQVSTRLSIMDVPMQVWNDTYCRNALPT